MSSDDVIVPAMMRSQSERLPVLQDGFQIILLVCQDIPEITIPKQVVSPFTDII